MSSATALQFDGWTVDPVSGDIVRSGTAARLTQQPLRVLVALYERAGAVVTREQLIKVLWPDGVVDFDNGLNVAVRKLRVALEDVGDTPKYIETLPRVGYRFIGSRGVAHAPAVAGSRVRSAAALALTLAVMALALAAAWWSTWIRGSDDPAVAAALAEDPLYAEAWAALAASITLAVHSRAMLPAEGLPKARAAALRAIDLDDRSSRAWQQLAIWHSDMGHPDESLAALRRARELDPLALAWSSNYARVLYSARRYDEAIRFLTPLVAANPKLDPAHSILAWALIATGDLAGAEEQLRLVTVPTINPSDMGFLYAKLGRRDDALRELERLETQRQAGYGMAYDEAIVYAALGEHSVLLGWMRLDPRLDPLRGRQCFADVETRVYPPSG